jgi:hypothetical protein
LQESRREPKKLFAGRREGRATLISNEKGSSQLLFKQAHACADCRLSDMQTFGGLNKATGRDNLHNRPGKLNVHLLSSTKLARKCQLNSFACWDTEWKGGASHGSVEAHFFKKVAPRIVLGNRSRRISDDGIRRAR